MTGDTFQTGGATTTRYKERKFTDEEKRNANLFPYFKKHEWLIGNNAFIESTRPLFRAYKPVTGTGTCELPTTVECLRGYFGDEISKVVFTDTLSLCKVSENLEAIRSFSETAKFLMEKKPYWMATEATIKDEYVRSNLFEWISFRLNWAYYKRDVIRRLYDRQLSQVTTNIYLHNNFAMNKQKRMDSTPIDTAFSAEELEEMAKSTPYSHFLQTLEKEMEENNITIMSIAMRSTALPVHTQFYDPYVSRDELSSTMASAPAASGEASHSSDSEGGESSAPTNKKFVANNTTFTYHRYWALYYIRLLEQFIDSHSHLCHAMTRHQDHAFVFKPMAPLPTQSVKELVENYDVPTTFHPFDELYAKWNWTPIQGHQGSRNILAERFPHELIFKYPMVYLYHIMQRRFPTFMIPAAEQEKVREYMLKTAQSVQKGWKENPLLPRDLLEGNTPWTLSETEEPFGPNKRFMWTLFTIIGRLEQLRSEVTEQEKGDEYRQDFYWHQIQVRLTGYLPIVRWMLNELMIEDPKQPDIFDSRVPEAMEYFQCDDMDFDGELDMPRLSVLLHLLNYWYNTGPYSKKNPILAALQKGIPFRSTARVLSNHFLNETKYNYHFISLTMMFTMVTTLGLFRRMKGAPPMYRPNFGTMVKIDFALLQTPKQLFNFIHVTKSKIIIYMSREVLVHAMAKAPHYRDHQLLNWSVLEKHTWEVCNDIRKYLRNYKFWLKAPFNVSRINLEDSIQTNHEQHYDLFLFPQQDFLHTIMHVFYSQHIKHLDKIIILQTQMKHLVRDLNNATPEAGHEELELKLRHTQAQLQLITYELDEPTRNIIWQTMIGKRNDIKLWSFIRQFLGDEDLILFHRLHEEYAHFTPKKKMELTVSQFSLRAFTMIYYLLQLQVQLKTYHLMALPQEMTREIHLAMRQRHHLFDTQPMLSSVYHAHVTLCCEKLATMHDTGSYGNSLIMYSRRGNYFACCRKRMKKAGYTAAGNTNASGQDGKKGGHSVSKSNDDDKDDDDEEDGEEEEEEEQNPEEEDAEGEEPTGGGGGEDQDEKRILVKIQKRKEKLADITKSTQKILDRIRKKQSMSNLIDKTRIGKDVSMDDYPTMSFKERRKIVCRLDMDTKPLECKNNPSVATFNLQGRSLVIGSEYAKMTTYQHCPKCGDLHTYSLKHYNNGQGYMCANCVQKYWVPSLEMQRHMFCVYCGRQHFKDVKQGLTMMPTIDVGDPTNPVKFFNYCNTDRPKYKYDYMFDRHNKNNTIHMLFLDTYLNRHHNMLRQDCMAYFPFQNTVQENAEHIDIKYNQFSWPLYGKRAHQIPQLIDVWWPSGSKL